MSIKPQTPAYEEAQSWIHGYLDGTLTDAEFAVFSEWLRHDPRNARQFADVAILHNRLAELHLTENSPAAADTANPPGATPKSNRSSGRRPRWWTLAGGVLAVCVVTLGLLVLFHHSTSPVAAATGELTRVIVAQARSPWRSYRLVVESSQTFAAKSESIQGERRRDAERRPPKPELNNARLHVGPGGRFVLAGDELAGSKLAGSKLAGSKLAGSWIAGSNGRQSWSVRDHGKVLVSADPLHFRRDVPGHEHAMPLNDLEAMMQRLAEAYDIVVWDDTTPNESTRRLIVATKRRGQRGPRQVEVSYDPANDQLLAIRFVDMPYGSGRLTLRLEPFPSPPEALRADFFEPPS